MKTRRLGSSDLDITPIGFGSWAMSGPNSPSYWGPQDDEVSVATIRHGVESGINWIDTAAIYGMGHAETVVAEAVSVFSEADRPFLFTKAGLVWDEPGPQATVTRSGGPESIRRELDASLTRLGVERIDLYQMHWPADDARVDEYWEVFSDAFAAGKVRAIGVSNHSLEQLDSALAVGPLHSNQAPLSLLRPDSLDDQIPWARERGVGTLVYSPMASGLLTGKFRAGRLDSLDEADWRRRSPLFTPENLARVDELVVSRRESAEAHETTVSSIAVAWAIAQDGVTGAIVGARTPEQCDDWVDAADLELTEDELDLLESARRRYAAR